MKAARQKSLGIPELLSEDLCLFRLVGLKVTQFLEDKAINAIQVNHVDKIAPGASFCDNTIKDPFIVAAKALDFYKRIILFEGLMQFRHVSLRHRSIENHRSFLLSLFNRGGCCHYRHPGNQGTEQGKKRYSLERHGAPPIFRSKS